MKLPLVRRFEQLFQLFLPSLLDVQTSAQTFREPHGSSWPPEALPGTTWRKTLEVAVCFWSPCGLKNTVLAGKRVHDDIEIVQVDQNGPHVPVKAEANPECALQNLLLENCQRF